jgi:hypothetical protein
MIDDLNSYRVSHWKRSPVKDTLLRQSLLQMGEVSADGLDNNFPNGPHRPKRYY